MKVLVVVGVLVAVLIVWGLIGSSQVAEVGNTCDFGVNSAGSVFCWKWHQNIIGDVGESINNIFNR